MQPIAMVTDLTGKSEPLYESKGFKLIEEVNGEYSLSFLILNSEKNKYAFPLVKEESVIEYKGIEYRIKSFNERNIGDRSAKAVVAHHKMFDLIDYYVYGAISGTKTLFQTLTFIFSGTPYTFDIADTFASVKYENFGDDNVLSLLQEVLVKHKAEIEINGTHFRFKKKISNKTDIQFRYKHNVIAINKNINSKNVSTYVKGYGKLKAEKDVLSGVKIPYSSRSGTWYTEPGLNQLATNTVGANFKFTFTGTGFNFDTILTFLGGKWEFTIDGNKSVKITTYKDVVSEHKTIEVIRGLEHKSHTVVATFKGKDSKNPYTKLKSDPLPIGYLKSGNIISLYRELVGDEQYMAVAEYTSPNASKFPSDSPDGLRHAPPIYDEEFTSVTALRDMLKSSLQDEPEVSITIDFAELRNAGYPYQHPIKGDEVFLIYEPMDIDIVTRIMRIETEEDFKGDTVKCAVTLANVGKSFAKVMGSFANTAKRLSRILTDDDKIKHDFLGEAVKRATAALQSAQTELEFENGIIARDKTNPNNLVLFNSAGLGISTNGGQTFDTAMTADGIVADAITTGTLRAIIIEGVEIYGSEIYGSRFISEDAPGIYTKIENSAIESRGVYTRLWRGQSEVNTVRIKVEHGQIRARNDDKNWSLYFNDFGISTYSDGDGETLASGIIEFHSKEYSPSGASTGLTLFSLAGRIALETAEARIYLNTGGPSVYVGDMNDNTFPIVASAFNQSSLSSQKRDIKDLDDNALDVIMDLKIKEYKRLTNGKATIYDRWQAGLILEEAPLQLIDGIGIDLYTFQSYTVQAFQDFVIEVRDRLDLLEGS
ncbi:phage tail spike protein [Sporosarcina jiandibaonis]|uniref:phage tail spike protein n=1 Tax=Sporosarcina jiandibaonis TaxID=2715535 RepID=UPI0015567037|nr:phage tail spike protein [Sporosarcina jiandibaonis]